MKETAWIKSDGGRFTAPPVLLLKEILFHMIIIFTSTCSLSFWIFVCISLWNIWPFCDVDVPWVPYRMMATLGNWGSFFSLCQFITTFCPKPHESTVSYWLQMMIFSISTFQGDPLSGTIFLIVFNPLIEYIKTHKNTQGYKLGNTPIITTPFADDFNLISNNSVKHKKLVADIESKASLSSQANADHFLLCRASRPTFHFIFPHRLQLTQW